LIVFKGRFIDQPNLPKLQTSQFASSQQTTQVLQAVAAEFSSNLNGYVVLTTKRRIWVLKDIILTSLSDAREFLSFSSLLKSQHFEELLNTNLV